jgi:hypothetical protein
MNDAYVKAAEQETMIAFGRLERFDEPCNCPPEGN